MNPQDRFPVVSPDTRWLLDQLADAMDGKGRREIAASRRGLALKIHGQPVCEGGTVRILRENYEAIRERATKQKL